MPADLLVRRIEEAALNAWPALQQVLYDGWILRFSLGHTKRANSVNPVYSSSLAPAEKIAFCEEAYAGQELPPIFRLTPLADPPDLDHLLIQRGYRIIDPTLVLFRELENATPTGEPPADLHDSPLDEWLAAYCHLRRAPLAQHHTHRAMLAAIPGQRFFATLAEDGQIVACGLAVLENGTAGLFDVITEPEQRNRGYGTRLVDGLITWAQHHGARQVYLQVEEANAPARHVYEAKCGFWRLYGYRYYVPD